MSLGRALRSEWTKLRSVNRWVITLGVAAALTIGVGVLAASGNKTDANQHHNFAIGPHNDAVADAFSFAHQPATGDTSLVVRVTAPTPLRPLAEHIQGGPMTLSLIDDPSPYGSAAAGIMIKNGVSPGASYASIMLTAKGHVRMQSDFSTDIDGGARTGPLWLKLTRTGATVTGYASADGQNWDRIGSVTPASLPATAEIGFYVSSPPAHYVGRGGGSSSMAMASTSSRATFDQVQLSTPATAWQSTTIRDFELEEKNADRAGESSFTSTGDAYTIVGSGMVGTNPPDDDPVETMLAGVLAAMMAFIAVGVLFATSEYRRGLIRTTFAATPRRGVVLAAKASVLGATTFVVALVGTTVAFLVARPVLSRNGFGPPAFHLPSLVDGPVIRALLLTSAFLAVLAVFALAVGFLLRHSAMAITLSIVLVVLPAIVATILPGTVPKLLMYTTLAGGLATQRSLPPTITLAEPWAMITPWAGLTVVCAYAAVALGLAWWTMRRRDA